MSIKRWKLIKKEDITPNKWFPLEKRQYHLPNNATHQSYTISTLADVAMIVPITTKGLVVMVKQFRPGINRIDIQFPSGRREKKHSNIKSTAIQELEDETGIRLSKNKLKTIGHFAPSPAKSTTITHCFLAKNSTFNSQQNLDKTEDIEVLTVNTKKIDQMIADHQIMCSQTISAWHLAKKYMN